MPAMCTFLGALSCCTCTNRVPAALFCHHFIKPNLMQTVANLGTISAVNLKGPGASDSWKAMTNTYGAAWEVSNQPSYPISLEVTSGSQTVSNSSCCANHVIEQLVLLWLYMQFCVIDNHLSLYCHATHFILQTLPVLFCFL